MNMVNTVVNGYITVIVLILFLAFYSPLAGGIAPVSYTHLDVYKRQELRMDIQPAFHYAGDGRLMEKVFSNVLGNAAVSYTHLDVYKRQHMGRSA